MAMNWIFEHFLKKKQTQKFVHGNIVQYIIVDVVCSVLFQTLFDCDFISYFIS